MALRVDTDTHIDVTLKQLLPFIDQPYRTTVATAKQSQILPHDIGDLNVAGRIKRPLRMNQEGLYTPDWAEVHVVFPTRILGMGLYPNRSLDRAIAIAYARWLTQEFLPANPGARGMLYLPIRDAEACRQLVAEYGGHPGVVGAFITNAGFPQIHENQYMGLYADMQERGLVLGFHPTSVWMEQPLRIFDRYASVWALGYPLYQCVHVVNWIVNGMPERFPALRCVFYESGIAWLSFVAHRLDQEVMKRPSEAPLLKERPSHYLARYHYSTQPVDQVDQLDYLEATIRLMGPNQFVYASNYPQWDFDAPAAISKLPFLTQEEQAGIFGENAARLFNLNLAAATEGSLR